jgi:hypothetical protein
MNSCRVVVRTLEEKTTEDGGIDWRVMEKWVLNKWDRNE